MIRQNIRKQGASLALPRREARSTRRRLRRKRHRKERIKALIETQGLMSVDDIKTMFSTSGFQKDVYALRSEGLDRILDNGEWVRVLIHLAQRRGYRSNSTAEAAKEKDTGVLKEVLSANLRLMEEKAYRTVGEMFCKDPKFQTTGPNGKSWRTTRNTSGDYRFTVTRGMIAAETAALFAAQRSLGNPFASENFEKRYSAILFSQRNFDEGPGGNSPYQKNDLRGYCTFEPEEHRAFKACYTFEYFKLLQDLNHIRILQDNQLRSLTPDERHTLISLALKSENLTYTKLRKALNIPESATFNTVHYGRDSLEETETKSKFPEMQSYHKIRKALTKIEKNCIQTLSHDQLDTIGTVLSLYKADDRRRAALSEIGLDETVISALLPLSFSKAGNLSLTAMKKLIPHLEKGVVYSDACTAVYGDHRGHTASTRQKTITLNRDLLDSGVLDGVTNPVVLRAISQTTKVLNAIIRKYGSPQLISIELAREMSKNLDERRKSEKSNEENRTRNQQAIEHIEEIKGDRATGIDIVKWKLWTEQDGICLYSGQPIAAERLFEPGYVDVDHIIPYSICFDDSYKNKVLVLASENRQKGNRLPLQYMAGNQDRIDQYITRVETSVRDFRKHQRLLKKELTSEDISGFKDRNLQDTQYITRAVYNLLRDHLEFAPSKYEKKPVRAVNGAVTDYMRKRIGLQKHREDGDLHHAMDAAVIAITTESMIQRVSRYAKRRELGEKVCGSYVDPETGELLSQADFDEKYAPVFPEPWPGFRQELLDRLSPDPYAEIMAHHLPNYEPDEIIHPIFVSRMPHRKVTGAAHEETIRSGKIPGYSISKTPLTALKLDKDGEIKNYYNPNDDILLYKALKKQLQSFDGDAKKAFTQPFHKPKKDGTPGPVVNKVKLCEKSTLNVATCAGIAKNGSMVRIDVFFVENDGYYFVPIYTADTMRKTLPNRASTAGKAHQDWEEMRDADFIFSLYPGDLIHVVSSELVGLQLSDKSGHGEPELKRKEWLLYFVKASISTASIAVETHDRKYSKGSLGIKRLVRLEKCCVDPLGQISQVHIPEKRQTFR